MPASELVASQWGAETIPPSISARVSAFHVPPLPSQAFFSVNCILATGSESGRPQMHGSGFAFPHTWPDDDEHPPMAKQTDAGGVVHVSPAQDEPAEPPTPAVPPLAAPAVPLLVPAVSPEPPWSPVVGARRQ